MVCSRDVAPLAPVRPDRPAGGGIEIAGQSTGGRAERSGAPPPSWAAK